jgi:hypothetical protein
MSDTRPSRSSATTSGVAYRDDPAPTGWTGWIAFAACMMLLLGTFQAIQGLVAIFDDGYYAVTEKGLVIDVDFTVWGWVHLLLGVLIAVSGVGILSGNMGAHIVGVLFAGLSAILNLLFIEAYPVWSIIVITVDVLVIFALTVHGREMKSY